MAKKKRAKQKTGGAAIKTTSDQPAAEGGGSGAHGKVNVSEIIRNTWDADRNLKPKAIVELLAARGITTNKGTVGVVLSKHKKSVGFAGRKRLKGGAVGNGKRNGNEAGTGRRAKRGGNKTAEDFFVGNGFAESHQLAQTALFVLKMGGMEQAEEAFANLKASLGVQVGNAGRRK